MISDEALYERLLDGELAAFDALYERYERRLFGFAIHHLKDRQEAEDVLHEAFLAVLREGRAGRETRSFRAWLFQVTRNLCLNRLRSRRRAARAIEAMTYEPSPPTGDPGRALEERRAAEALRQAVARLPSRLAEVYELRAEGLSYDELAQVLSIPVGTVKSRMHELIGRLRQEMSS